MTNNINLKDYNNINDYKKFIENHPEIQSLSDFKIYYGKLYSKYLYQLHNNIITDPLPIKSKRVNYSDNTSYNTVSDFQKYIDENNIKSNTELRETNLPLYNRATRLKNILNKLIYPGKINHHLLDTIPKIQKFVYENNISSKKELKRRFISVYRNYLKLRTDSSDVIFCTPILESDHERRFLEELVKGGVNLNDIYFQYSPNWAKDKRYDFFIKSKNLLIEVHGRQHFNPELLKDVWNCENTIDNDKLKYNLAYTNGYKLIYFTYYENEYKEFGYFEKVYTDAETLLSDNFTNLSINLNYLDDIKLLFQKDFYLKKAEEIIISSDSVEIIEPIRSLKTLNDINNFIIKHKIKSPKELKTNYLPVYNKSESFGWVNKLYYFTEDEEIGNIKNYKTIEDIQKFINKNKIKSRSEFRKDYIILYNKSWRKKWLDNLVYYKDISDDIS